MNDIIKEWPVILDILRKEHEISDVSYDAWIKPLQIEKVDGNDIYIICESELNQSYINRKYLKPLSVIIEEHTGTKYNVNFILPEQAKDLFPDNSSSTLSETISDNIGLNPSYTFDTFVVGQSNRFARAAALAVADTPGEIYNPLFLYGGVGLGKTHLMQSVAHYVHEHNPAMKILYVSSETFTNELIEAIREGNTKNVSKFREKYRNIDVLLIDDIQFIIGKEATQEEFFHTFNELYNARKQIIITSDKPPKDMETLEERIRSRFECGLTADIGQPDYETRIAILRKKQEKDGINLSDEVLDYIARNIKSNVRELEGALNKLAAFKKLTGAEEITLETAETELSNVINPNVPREITLQLIVEIVSEHFNITLEQMLSKSRAGDIVRPRMIAMYLAKNMTNSSLDAIGTFLGGRDHSTIIHGIKQIGAKIDEDPDLKNQISIIRNKISPS